MLKLDTITSPHNDATTFPINPVAASNMISADVKKFTRNIALQPRFTNSDNVGIVNGDRGSQIINFRENGSRVRHK